MDQPGNNNYPNIDKLTPFISPGWLQVSVYTDNIRLSLMTIRARDLGR